MSLASWPMPLRSLVLQRFVASLPAPTLVTLTACQLDQGEGFRGREGCSVGGDGRSEDQGGVGVGEAREETGAAGQREAG